LRRKFRHRTSIGAELKYNKAENALAEELLHVVASTDVVILWVAIKKRRGSRIAPMLLYDKMVRYLLETTLKAIDARIIIVKIDRFSRRADDQDRTTMLIRSVHHDKQMMNGPLKLEVSYVDSMRVPEIQVHDFVVGSIFRSLERNDNTHLGIIKDKVVFGKIITMKDLSNGIWKDQK
jgi:hypothetical protein